MRLALLLGLVLTASAHGQPVPVPHPERLDAIGPALQAFVDRHELAGAVAVVGRSAGVARTAVVGNRSLDPAAPLTEASVFRIASMTKPVTALAVMQLVESGKIGSIDDPVEKYLPEFRGQKLITKRDGPTVTLAPPPRPISLRDLLTHTSGLPSGVPPGLQARYAERSLTLAETTLAVSQQPLDFPPGTKWGYCNSGIDVLGRVVEVVSGEPFEGYLQAHVFKPLGMADTTTRPTAELLTRLATVYDRQGDRLTPAKPGFLDPLPGAAHPLPCGGLVSTAPDLARLYRCLLSRGELNGVRVIKPETLAVMTRTQTGDLTCGFTDGMSFGLGFAVVKTPAGITADLSPGTFGHGGAFGTQSWADPKQDVFVILLIARTGLKNSDASPYRAAVQKLAVEAVRP